MRVSDNMNYGQVNKNLSKNRSESLELNSQAASQKRVNKPSDDPVSAVKSLATRTELGNLEQFMRNINSTKQFVDYSEQTLGELTDYLTRAKELAIQQSSSGSSTPSTRKAVAGEINQIFSQMVNIGNRKLGDRFVFGGFRTLQPPFDPAGNFTGDTGQMMIEIGKGTFVSMNLPGNFVFMGDKIDARAATTDSGTVPQSTEQLRDAIENSHLQVPTREVLPEGVDPQELDTQETRQDQQQQQHAVPAPVMRGPASLEPGPPPSHAAQASAAHPSHSLNANSANNSNHPSEPGHVKANSGFKPERGENVFGVLSDLEIGLRTNDTHAIQDTLNRIDTCIDQVVNARSQLGTRQTALQSQLESLQRYKGDAKGNLSQLEDVDVYQLYNDLAKNENTLKATMSSGGKLVQMSLLDFLR